MTLMVMHLELQEIKSFCQKHLRFLFKLRIPELNFRNDFRDELNFRVLLKISRSTSWTRRHILINSTLREMLGRWHKIRYPKFQGRGRSGGAAARARLMVQRVFFWLDLREN